MFRFRNIAKAHLSLVVTMVLVSMFAGALIQTKQVSAATGATWNPSLGWDFECHTHTHPSFTGLSTDTPPLTDAQIVAELQAVNTAFQNHGYPPPQHMAYPYGDYNSHVETVISAYRKSARTVSDDMTTYPVPNWYELNAAQLIPTTTMTDVNNWVTQCINTKSLLIIFTHDVSASPSAYGCTPTMLTSLLNYLVQQQNAGKIQVMTIAQAYDAWHNASTQPPPTVVVAFDDANESDYLVAYPLFAARGLKGTSYIVTSYIDEQDQLHWTEIATMHTGTINYAIHLESKQTTSATSNLGTMSFNGTSYTLPANFLKKGGYYQAQYSPPTGCTFDHWETTGAVTVASTTTNPTTVTVNSNGTLRAMYKNTATATYIFGDGFESGNFNAWTGTYNTASTTAPKIDASHVYAGTRSAKFTASGGSSVMRTYCYENLLTTLSTEYAQAEVYIDSGSLTTNGKALWLIQIRDSSGNALGSYGIKYQGTMATWACLYGSSNAYANSGPSTGKWYKLEAYFTKASSGTTLALYVNGVKVTSLAVDTSKANNAQQTRFGIAYLDPSYSFVVHEDNCIINNAYIG